MHQLLAGLLSFFVGITSFFTGGHGTALANNPNQAVLHAAVSPAPSGTLAHGKVQGLMMRSVKGTNFADNPFLSKHGYLVYPVQGSLSADVQAALVGWKVSSTQNSDGTIAVTLTPSNTEQEDHAETFTMTTGEKLYFIELNPVDDQNTEDVRWADDFGILVDANGVIQNDMPKPSFPPRGQGVQQNFQK